MLRNQFLIAWRNLRKNGTFAFINIFGLAVSFTCCMLIALYVRYEGSYDSFQEKKAGLYQVGTVSLYKDQPDDVNARTSGPVAAAMKQEFPEVLDATRIATIFSADKTLLSLPGGDVTKSIYETGGYMADPSLFNLFTFRFIEGMPAGALADPNSVVLSAETAGKLFGHEPALLRRIRISNSVNGEYDYVVKGVYTSFDGPSHIDPRFIVSMMGGDMGEYIRSRATSFATNNFFYTYLLLREGVDPSALEAKFPAFIKKYYANDLQAMGRDKRQFLVPVTDVHLSEKAVSNVTPGGSPAYLKILSAIAVLTLVIACVNFMNLSTARSAKRSAEIGIRKVLGAERILLILQFLGEAVFMSFVAFAVSLLLARLFLPLFSEITGKQLSFTLADGTLMLWFFGVALLTGLLAGCYPALYLSSFKPVKILKRRFEVRGAVVSLRKALVVFQFVISISLIVSSVVINKQMSFMQHASLGFAKEQQLVIPLRSPAAKANLPALKQALTKRAEVISIGASTYYPGIVNKSDNVYYRKGYSMQQARGVKMNRVDDNFLTTLDIKLSAGRLFSSDFRSDSVRSLVINEKAVKDLGFASPAEAVGDQLYFNFQDSVLAFDIVGVVKDFHFEGLQSEITPYAFSLGLSHFNFLVIHCQPGSAGNLVAGLDTEWRKLNPGEPFDYSFLDADFNKNYDAGKRVATIVSAFTLVAILVSCLGLFGLASFSAEQRTREIGIRKVLGASSGSILGLLSAEFLKPVSISMIIAFPAAGWIMHKWLLNFAYPTSLNGTVFLATAGIAWFIALLTISFQSLRAAHANPVNSLRAE